MVGCPIRASRAARVLHLHTPQDRGDGMSAELSPEYVQEALSRIIADLDYDLHKQINEDEETGEDRYPELAADFIAEYKAVEAGK